MTRKASLPLLGLRMASRFTRARLVTMAAVCLLLAARAAAAPIDLDAQALAAALVCRLQCWHLIRACMRGRSGAAFERVNAATLKRSMRIADQVLKPDARYFAGVGRGRQLVAEGSTGCCRQTLSQHV